jgi:osmoprotectant transport system substrate-binding protein
VYQPAITIRKEVLDANPTIQTVLEPVFATLDEATLSRLNGEIAISGAPAEDVASAYLKEAGFLQ